MQKRKSAWNILRLALLWARKGGVFLHLKKRLSMMDLSEFLKSLGHSQRGGGALHLGGRELSFDATPMVHVKMHRPNSMRFRLPHIPCINPQAADHDYSDCDFDDINDDDDGFFSHRGRKSFLIRNGEDEVKDYEEEDIDAKAEEFIANFYEQLKLQRQISYIQCN